MKKSMTWNAQRKNVYRFEHPSFEPKEVNEITKIAGTKFKKLLSKITELDKADMAKNKKLYK